MQRCNQVSATIAHTLQLLAYATTSSMILPAGAAKDRSGETPSPAAQTVDDFKNWAWHRVCSHPNIGHTVHSPPRLLDEPAGFNGIVLGVLVAILTCVQRWEV